MTLNQLQAYVHDHQGHDVSYEDQEFISCLDCGETFELPEGTGVRIIETMDLDSLVILEVPSGIQNGHVTYTIDLATFEVSI